MKQGKIIIQELAVSTHIGVTDEERSRVQTIILSLTLSINLDLASKSDNISDTVNYKTVYDEVILLVENAKFKLLERLAGEIITKCLSFKGVKAVIVKITKPNRLTNTKGVSIEMSSNHE